MNAREAMQALLNGKIVRDCKNNLQKIDEESGMILTKSGDKDWVFGFTIWNAEFELVEEYPLTFKEALMAMLDGKIVKPEGYDDAYRFRGEFQFSVYADESKDVWDILEGFEDCVQRGKWKVVE